MFLLSHHRADELHRTYRVAGLNVCARCLGLYPALVGALLVQSWTRAPLLWKEDMGFAIFLCLPGLLDWAISQGRPWAGNNPARTATGAALGLALGRTLYIHLHRPWPRPLLVQVAVILGIGVPAWVAGAASRRRRELPATRRVSSTSRARAVPGGKEGA